MQSLFLWVSLPHKGMYFVFQVLQGTQLNLLQGLLLRQGQVTEQCGGAHIAEHGFATAQITQGVVRIQIAMQQSALVQMVDGGTNALN